MFDVIRAKCFCGEIYASTLETVSFIHRVSYSSFFQKENSLRKEKQFHCSIFDDCQNHL